MAYNIFFNSIFYSIFDIITVAWCAFMAGITLQKNCDKNKAIIRWTFLLIANYLIALLINTISFEIDYKFNPNMDIAALNFLYSFFVIFLRLLRIFTVCVGAIWIYKGSISTKLFTSILISLMAAINTTYFCNITNTIFNISTNSLNNVLANIPWWILMILIQIIWFTLFYILYKKFFCKIVKEVINTPDGKMGNFVLVPIVSFITFQTLYSILVGINIITQNEQTFFYFVAIFGIIIIIYFLMFWSIFKSVIISTQAMKTEAELEVASKIQSSILPCTFPAFPDRKEFDIYASMNTAKEVGGDFYDFFLVDDNKIAIVIADVSGKGVPAALFMMTARTLIKNQLLLKHSVEQTFINVNNQLCENNEVEMFVTSFLGLLDIKAGEFLCVNAGHNPPLIKRANQKFEWLKTKKSFVLGGMQNIKYKSQSVQIQTGDIIFLYTDGVTEAVNKNLDLYSDERLYNELNSINDEATPADIINKIKISIDEFSEGCEQADDITMLALKYFSEGV